jgi:hypothetical protein
MPALTITAVDHNTDQLTITGHGLLTGAGPAAVRNVGGVHPTGLAAVTDYWIIRVDDNTIKLADSSANALAGTAINLTGNGSGTNILELGIPYRRARTYVPRSVDVAGARLKSADLNAMQDALTAIYDLLTGQAQQLVQLGVTLTDNLTLAAHRHVTISGLGRYKHGDRTLVIPASAFVADGNNTRLTQNGYQTFNAVAKAYAPIALPAGKRIKTVTVYYDPQGAASVTPALIRRDLATFTRSAIWTGAADGTGTAIETQTSSPNYTMVETETYEVEVTMTGAGNRLYAAAIVFDEP